MLSPQLRQKVFNLWTMFWSSGMTNPLTSIEQITYLLFLKRLEALDQERVKAGKPSIYGPRPNCNLSHHPDDKPGPNDTCNGHPTCRWSYIRQNPDHDHISQYVFPWLRVLDDTFEQLGNGENGGNVAAKNARMMEDAYFQLPREKSGTLQKAVAAIDDLFNDVDAKGTDIMGDIFEYLLSEIQTSGKQGQFRTPRHIIRFMVELIDPKPGERIVDPAAGTGGFLFSSIQHLMKQATDPEMVLLEWDGTPHRAWGGNLDVESALIGENFAGYDIDRTMVRIGWMNMILHGIENPSFIRRDTLSKQMPDSESEQYDVVLANPPFTGTVDKTDLHESRFPRHPNRSKDPITNKSELLFVWLMLDLLRVGGRCAVIVPEGVLFGSTNAHKALRRALLFEHDLQAVISLPAGVFQPYAGVKTSILLFRKVRGKNSPQPATGEAPRTHQVWFYEVKADGYTLDAKRNPRPEPNDLWDALHKFPERVADSTDYYQPEFYTVRWRMVDEGTLKIFPALANDFQGGVWGIDELFGLPQDPTEAAQLVKDEQQHNIQAALLNMEADDLRAALEADSPGVEEVAMVFTKAERALNRALNVLIREQGILDTEFEQHGRNTLKEALAAAVESLRAQLDDEAARPQIPVTSWTEDERTEKLTAILKAFARLDGYDVRLRTRNVHLQPNALDESRSWAAPVRVWAVDEDWTDGAVQGSHDENGQVRPEYIDWLIAEGKFNPDGTVNDLDLLAPDCIEANDFNLSAGRYKPFVLQTKDYRPPAEILRAVRELETQLIEGVDRLLGLLEGEE